MRLTMLVPAMVMSIPAMSLAQERVVERHGFEDPEGRLLAFYSAAMAFSPAGLVPGAPRVAVTLEVSHVPYLNAAQRRPSIDKPEATNLAPFFPRPRVMVRAGAWALEASWIPPMRVFDVEANLVSVSVAGPAAAAGPVRLTPRVWATIGRVRGAMTCSRSTMLGHGTDLETYFATICHGRESDDWFEPRMLGGELLASRLMGSGGISVYAALGARVDRTRFDIGVITDDGGRDADHPILELRTVRPHGAIGASWRVARGVDAGSELFYAPGSLLTGRISGRWAIRR